MLMWLLNTVIGKIDFNKIDPQVLKNFIDKFLPKLTDEQKAMFLQALAAGAAQAAVAGAMKQ